MQLAGWDQNFPGVARVATPVTSEQFLTLACSINEDKRRGNLIPQLLNWSVKLVAECRCKLIYCINLLVQRGRNCHSELCLISSYSFNEPNPDEVTRRSWKKSKSMIRLMDKSLVLLLVFIIFKQNEENSKKHFTIRKWFSMTSYRKGTVF